MEGSGSTAEGFRIPSLIKRNITLFALSQSFTGAGVQFAFGFGPLMVIALTGSADFAGLFVGLIGLSRFFVSYPIGKVTDLYGRKPGILMGQALALVGAVTIGGAMTLGSFAWLAFGMLLFGMGMNAGQQLRVAATDMFPPRHRGQALGYVAMGTVVGLIFSPALVSFSAPIAEATRLHELAVPWLLLPVLIIIGMLLVRWVRPDPKEIGMHLDRYYPGVVPVATQQTARADFGVLYLLRNARIRLAIVANCAAQGNMSMVMVLTSLVLHDHGHSLFSIAVSQTFHSAGMFAFTIPLGRLGDRIGYERVMMPGVAVALIGAATVAFTHSWASVTIGTFLVGIGWAAANVAATALLADYSVTEERGRAIGLSESCAGAVSVAMGLVTGPLLESSGVPATGLVAVVVAVPPLVMFFAGRRRMVAS